APAKALEATGSIEKWQPGYGPRINVSRVAEDEACNRPVHHRHLAVLITGAEYEVRFLYGLQELRQVRRVMREIRVHLEDEVVAALQRPFEACEVRGAQPKLGRTVDHVHTLLRLHYLVDYRTRTVRRPVVHHQYLQPLILLQNSLRKACDVLALVVGGNDYQCPLSHARPSGPGRLLRGAAQRK